MPSTILDFIAGITAWDGRLVPYLLLLLLHPLYLICFVYISSDGCLGQPWRGRLVVGLPWNRKQASKRASWHPFIISLLTLFCILETMVGNSATYDLSIKYHWEHLHQLQSILGCQPRTISETGNFEASAKLKTLKLFSTPVRKLQMFLM